MLGMIFFSWNYCWKYESGTDSNSWTLVQICHLVPLIGPSLSLLFELLGNLPYDVKSLSFLLEESALFEYQIHLPFSH